MAPPVLKTADEYRKLVDSVDTFLLDCDGVIYHGAVVVPGVKETLHYLRSIGERPASDEPSVIPDPTAYTYPRQEDHLCHQQCLQVSANVQKDL